MTEGRRRGMARVIAHLAASGQLRLPEQRATDILVVLFSHETFLGLTHAGRPVAEYKTWLHETLCAQLLQGRRTSSTRRFGADTQ